MSSTTCWQLMNARSLGTLGVRTAATPQAAIDGWRAEMGHGGDDYDRHYVLIRVDGHKVLVGQAEDGVRDQAD